MFYLENTTYSCSPDKCEFDTLAGAYSELLEIIRADFEDKNRYERLKDFENEPWYCQHFIYDRLLGKKYVLCRDVYTIYEVDKIPRPNKKLECMTMSVILRHYEDGFVLPEQQELVINSRYEAMI